MTEFSALPEGHDDRAAAPPATAPATADIRPAGAPAEDQHAVGVDDQAGGDEAGNGLVVDGVQNLGVQGHQPVDLQSGPATALPARLVRHDAVLGIPERADVEQGDAESGLTVLRRLTAREVLHRPIALADVVRVDHAELAELVFDDLVDDLAGVLQALAERQANARRLVRASVVGQLGCQIADLRLGQTEAEPVVPVAELIRVLVDRGPGDGLRRRRQKRLERRAIHPGEVRPGGGAEIGEETAREQILHLLGVGLTQLLPGLDELRKRSGCRHDSPPFYRLSSSRGRSAVVSSFEIENSVSVSSRKPKRRSQFLQEC